MSNISNIIALNTTVNDLMTSVNFSTTLFDNKMKSTTANNVFNDFEKAINKLYEKTRLLNDLRHYTLDYITTEYNNKYNTFMSLLKTIEESSEEYQNNDVIAHNIEFSDSILKYTDRDGSPADRVSIINKNTICPAHEQVGKEASISQIVTSDSNDIYYNKNIDTGNKTYSVLYLSETLDNITKTESIKYVFDTDRTINFIDVSPFNADIESIDIISSDNTIIKNTNNSIFLPQITAKGVQINLISKKFEARTLLDNNT